MLNHSCLQYILLFFHNFLDQLMHDLMQKYFCLIAANTTFSLSRNGSDAYLNASPFCCTTAITTSFFK